MGSEINPALARFVHELQPEKVWGQALVSFDGATFGLRHVEDRDAAPAQLRRVGLGDLRLIALNNPAGEYRPLKTAPDLQRGWIFSCSTPSELWRALQELYPGSIPDWFACLSGAPPVTNYRPFTSRQSGMYRVTQLLTDAQAAQVIRATCAPHFCLKRRLWSIEGLAPDAPAGKSEIPCLEPCAILLEMARKAARIEQEEKMPLEIAPGDLAGFVAAVEALIRESRPSERGRNPGSPLYPRRLQLLLEKFGGKVERVKTAEIED